MNTATNQTGSVDANGNTLSSYNGNQEYSLSYDPENRVAGVANINGNPFTLDYAYDAQNRRTFIWNGSEDSLNNPINYTVNVYTPSGQKLAAYTLSPSLNTCGLSLCMEVALASSDQYFGGRRVAVIDQLGSAGNSSTSGGTYFPWGEPKGSTNPQNTWSFATYWQDSTTGLNYANNRYHSNAYGRFMTPDPCTAGGAQSGSVNNPGDPGSWNRYAYTRGDPVNRADPGGTCDLGISFWGSGDGWFAYTYCDASLGPDFNASAYAECLAMPGCYTPLPGGGDPAAAHINVQTASGTTQDQQQALDNGIDSAWAHILSNPQCASFLTGNKGGSIVDAWTQLATILSNTTYTFSSGLPSNTAATTTEGGNQVTIRPKTSAKTARPSRPCFLTLSLTAVRSYLNSSIESANNRYYSSSFGRFMTPDPYQASGGPSDPQSWNTYAYALGDPVNGNDPEGLDSCGNLNITSGTYAGQTVSQVMTGTSGNDDLAQLLWHEGGTLYSSDLTSQSAISAYVQDLTGIGTAVLNQLDVDDGKLSVYQNGTAVCPLGQCLDRNLQQVIYAIATKPSGRGGKGRMTHIFNTNGNLVDGSGLLNSILNTDTESRPLITDEDGLPINQGCEGVLASIVVAGGLLDGSISRLKPNGLTLLFWNHAPANSTTTFPGSVGYTGRRDSRAQGHTFWGLSSTPSVRQPPGNSQ